ncbi:hypothetical protein [Aneurinibacillus tyrosinisolvens]|uniref:hypothetical protein n=1 Tax=Aneurinibacillus tyrosinisolvens TaxID=1443435 RepID=UPI00063F3D66|nr:hypothetical protein [Aneurinibacillus tyrosinisolvens]
MKRLLGATLLGASLLVFNVGSASAASTCPFANGAQNFGSNTGTQQLNPANDQGLNNLVQQAFANNNNITGVPAKQSNCPAQLFNAPASQQAKTPAQSFSGFPSFMNCFK